MWCDRVERIYHNVIKNVMNKEVKNEKKSEGIKTVKDEEMYKSKNV